MLKDFNKCNVLIYDENDKLLVNARIYEHDARENYIVIQDWPELSNVEKCKLLILTSPAPYSYHGVIHRHRADRLIRLYEEVVRDSRGETRYKTDLPAKIEYLIYDGKAHPLHTKLNVKVVNISKNGLRIHGKDNVFNIDDHFTLSISMADNEKHLTGKVMNKREVPPDESEYGCRLVSSPLA
jgi:hypothetical protein